MNRTAQVRIGRDVQKELRLQTVLKGCTQEELATKIISDWLKIERAIYRTQWQSINCEQAN